MSFYWKKTTNISNLWSSLHVTQTERKNNKNFSVKLIASETYSESNTIFDYWILYSL